MPKIFQLISAILPATYFIDIMRGIVLRGATIGDLAVDYAALAVLGIGMFSLCAARFQKHIA